MNALKRHIKDQKFASVYLLYGEEDYLRLMYRDKLKEAIIGDDLTMNYSYYEGQDIEILEVIDKTKTLPFFNDKRLIIVENSKFFEVQSPLADNLNDLPESTYIIFVEKKIDKRTKLYKEIKKLGSVTEFKEMNEKNLKMFVVSLMQKSNKSITEKTVNYLLEKTGTDMINIQNEVEKLVSYAYEREIITIDDIDEVCVGQVEDNIFPMIDAIIEKNRDRALSFYYDLIELKVKPRNILHLLSRHFKILIQVKELYQQGRSNQEIASKVGVHPYFVRKYISQAREFSVKKLIENLSLCNNTEKDLNIGNKLDQIGVEVLIIQFT